VEAQPARRSVAAVAALLLVVVTGAVVTAPSASADIAAVTALSVSPGSLAVSGLLGSQVATVTVSVTADPPVGVSPEEPGAICSGHVYVALHRLVGAPTADVLVQLNLASGDLSSGTWTGDWRVASTRDGTWVVSQVGWCNGRSAMDPLGPDGVVVDPRTIGLTRTLVVAGQDQPRVTVTRVPTVAVWGKPQSERFVYTNVRGTPLAGRRITYGEDTSCGFSGDGGATPTLDNHGGITVDVGPLQRCLYLTNPPTSFVTPTTTVVLKNWVTGRYYYRGVAAGAVAPTFQVGAPLRVVSSATPRLGTVSLQVLVGRTWRTIDAKTMTSNPATASLHIPSHVRASLALGRHVYRVLAAPLAAHGDLLVATASRPFTVTGV
jgi:hypothetical protein